MLHRTTAESHLKPHWGYMVCGGELQNEELKDRFSSDLSCEYERCRAGVQARTFLLFCRSGDDICQQSETISITTPVKSLFGDVLKANGEKYQMNSRKCRKRPTSHSLITHFWRLHGVMGLQLSPLFPVSGE